MSSHLRRRLLIADDHVMVSEGLRSALSPRFDVVGLVLDGGEVLDAIKRLYPDIVLLDLSMPGRPGLQILEDLQREAIDVRVVVVTMHNEASLCRQAFALGAAAFVPKGARRNKVYECRSTSQRRRGEIV
jgi:DNA-binding NarL/FixJ family response regulator